MNWDALLQAAHQQAFRFDPFERLGALYWQHGSCCEALTAELQRQPPSESEAAMMLLLLLESRAKAPPRDADPA